MDTSISAVLVYSLVAGAILVYVPFLAVGWGRLQVGYDYKAPRTMLEKLPPFAKRATWAHQNAFESFIIYAPAAIMAYVTGVNSPWAFWAVILYLVARFLYPIFYILDIASARSLMFALGSLSIWTLYALSVIAVNS
ncbi:hypothetical protein FRE64_13750 [Euhalothece natronophila Z-M001]|uniref:MAPEG family protein n=1 Tax=Euhalothece natronophila Z-M001 TaxID=522448 RepID=A0A5B8NNS8_9CHRO|nr:MAPEG family protein [Euhalothece natronophila]QDZ40912.1 hypothetical protein FRE64_13750 [Euhalothece natronophila Z-M001]